MKGILFDLDGTLLDSMHVWVRLAYDYLDSLEVKAPVDLRERIKTMSLKEAMQYFRDEYGIEKTTDEMLQDTNRILAGYYHNTIELKPHIEGVLDELYTRGHKMAVATATADELSKPALAHHGLDRYFLFTQTVKNTGHGKHDPAFWLEGANRMQMEPNRIVVFEDAYHCIQGAKAAGMRVIAIEDESAQRDREKIIKTADIYLRSFREFVPEMLEDVRG